jgi:hypothetical protein
MDKFLMAKVFQPFSEVVFRKLNINLFQLTCYLEVLVVGLILMTGAISYKEGGQHYSFVFGIIAPMLFLLAPTLGSFYYAYKYSKLYERTKSGGLTLDDGLIFNSSIRTCSWALPLGPLYMVIRDYFIPSSTDMPTTTIMYLITSVAIVIGLYVGSCYSIRKA